MNEHDANRILCLLKVFGIVNADSEEPLGTNESRKLVDDIFDELLWMDENPEKQGKRKEKEA